jgi:hypothetical protein
MVFVLVVAVVVVVDVVVGGGSDVKGPFLNVDTLKDV